MEDSKSGNPEAVDNAVFGSSDNFFDALENDVNGAIADEAEPKVEETSQGVSPDNTDTVSPKEVSQEPSEAELLKKRYSDSSREAQRLRAELNELKPFVPVLDAMKKDSGLVDHVRGYFQNGGEVPGNVKEQLKLDEDFQFDTEDLVNNPDSDSRKVFNTMVDKVVNKRATEILEREKQENIKYARKQRTRELAQDFMQRSGMNEEQFADFVIAAKDRFSSQPLSFDDMYALMNKQNVNQNVANATKEDMLSQMKNVREIPTSQSGSNNAGDGKASPSDSLFDSLLDVDGNLDNMFS
tara:strand:- start:370 stop:1260 length:891 start_codon:yes stop_codon:yes gene_type:complete